MSALRLHGRTVAITGGAGGIGRETAIAMAGAGAHVAIGDIDGEAARETAALIAGRAAGYAVDVRDPDSIASFIDTAGAELGPVLVFVNNAGVMPLGAFAEEDDEVTRRIIDVNLWGVIHGTRLAIREMQPRGEGHIVNVASLMGRSHAAGAATYGASKHAVVGLGGAVREELVGSGITLTTILPSAVRTPLISGLKLSFFPPVVEPHEVAAAIVASCRHQRAEVTVPRWLGRSTDIERLLPNALTTAARRRFGGDAALHGVDAVAREAYESRVRDAELVV
jgi:NAD(P)-dependent dehydrogenase (short-subunit alcohol dehydrogenase family)